MATVIEVGIQGPAGPMGPSSSAIVSEYAPSYPTLGTMWFNISTAILSIFVSDVWVPIAAGNSTPTTPPSAYLSPLNEAYTNINGESYTS